MKTTTRKNKTYNKQATKRERKINLSVIFGALSLVFLLSTYSAASDYIMSNRIKENNTPKQNIYNIDIKDLSIIYISSENEKIAYLAIFQACDALLPGNTSCVSDMIAIAKTENTNFCYNCAGSDSYHSSGLYQISLYYHPNLTLDQINDPYFSANWTLKRLIANNYPTNRSNTIRLHNGNINNPKTAIYLSKVNNYINLINNK